MSACRLTSLSQDGSELYLSNLHAVHLTKDYLLVALFDWHGTPSAAEFCAQNVTQVTVERELIPIA